MTRRSRSVGALGLCAALVVSMLAAPARASEPKPFTIVVIGDTQSYVSKGYGHLFEESVRWIAENARRLNIVFVTQEGDIVQNSRGNLHSKQWVRAHQIMSILDGRVPYSVTLGDHDYDRKERHRAGTSHFVHYFGKQRYAGQPWYGGSHPFQTSHYQFIDAGGRRYLHLNLECDVPGKDKVWDHVAWAQSIIDRYPGMPTIVTTHNYLTDGRKLLVAGGFDGRTEGPELFGGDRRSGEDIWNDLIRKNPQIFLVLNGNQHMGPMHNNGEYHQVSYNDAGLPVFEVLTNYQGYPRGGDGWLRLLTFDEAKSKISFHAYSPTRRQFRRENHGTPRASQFALKLNFNERLGPRRLMPFAEADPRRRDR